MEYTQDLHEVIGAETLQQIANERPVKVLWSVVPSGLIHIGYYIPILKIAQLVKAGCIVTILIADLHALLENTSSTEKQVANRSEYYIKIIKSMLCQLQVDMKNIIFIKGTAFQLNQSYTMDVYRLNKVCSLRDATYANGVKDTMPTMAGLLCPIFQALDEEYLQVDAQLGSVDQRKSFMFSREYLPQIGYNKRIHLLIKDIPELKHENTKLGMLDLRSEIKKTINASHSVLDILNHLLFPLLNHIGEDFVIFRREEDGGSIIFKDFNKVFDDYMSGELSHDNLIAGVVHAVDLFIEPVRKGFESREWRRILKHAYDFSA